MSAKPGYDDTPILPNSNYRVHDKERPQPRVVSPGTESSQAAPGTPPSDAIVLFDGTNLDGWLDGKNAPARWKVENGHMEVVPKTGDIHTKMEFGDCQLHVEWATPAKADGGNMTWGNSGVLMLGRFEIQILESHDSYIYADGNAGAIYGQYPPLVNACRKPGEWQSYDILFVAPRFDGKHVVTPAFMTVLQNGVVVQHHRALQGSTLHRELSNYKLLASRGPLALQDHGDLVRYRNIWIEKLN